MRSIPNVNHVSGTDLKVLACPARFERATSTLEGRAYEYFGNNFGNKDVVFLQTLIPPIDLAERRSYYNP